MAGFKSAYTPKTTYGNEIKNYFETNPTPSVAWVREEGKRYRQEFGSDYGLEDENFLTDEYIKYREDNGINTQYKLTYSNPQGAVVSDATAKRLSGTIASTPEGGGNAPSETPVNAPSTEPVTTPAPAAAPVETAPTTPTANIPEVWTGDTFRAQIEKNKQIANSKLDDTSLSPAAKEEIRSGMNYDTVLKNYDARNEAAEEDYRKSQSRFGQNAEYLAQSGLANSGFSDASDNAAYAAMQQAKVAAQNAATEEMASGEKTLWERVKAETDEETRKMLEKEDGLLQDIYSMGLTGEEATNYLIENGVDPDRAAGIVRADVESYYNTMVPQAASAYVEYIRKGASPEEARFILEGLYPKSYVDAAIQRATDSGVLDNMEDPNAPSVDELIQNAYTQGLTGDAAISYLTSQGIDESEAKTAFDSFYKSTVSTIATEYAQLLGSDCSDAVARMILEGKYNKSYIDAAVSRIGQAEAEEVQNTTESLNTAFTSLMNGDIAGASGTLKSVLGITDEEWNAEAAGGAIGVLIREKADGVSDSTLRSYLYSRSIVYDIDKINDKQLGLISDFQKLIEETTRKGILGSEDLTRVIQAMSDKLNVSNVKYDAHEGDYLLPDINFTINGEKMSIDLKEVEREVKRSIRNSVSSWTKVDSSKKGSIYFGVVVIDGRENLIVMKEDSEGSRTYFRALTGKNIKITSVKKPVENLIYNALIGKYRDGEITKGPRPKDYLPKLSWTNF